MTDQLPHHPVASVVKALKRRKSKRLGSQRSDAMEPMQLVSSRSPNEGKDLSDRFFPMLLMNKIFPVHFQARSACAMGDSE